jgi:hypothetical protein
MAKKTCEHCGASMVEYKHGLSVGLVTGLIKIAKVKNPINIKQLGLTRNQWDNFQKLKYWDLVDPGKRREVEGRCLGDHQEGSRFRQGRDLDTQERLDVPRSVLEVRGR